jgi:hypothetical protein
MRHAAIRSAAHDCKYHIRASKMVLRKMRLRVRYLTINDLHQSDQHMDILSLGNKTFLVGGLPFI